MAVRNLPYREECLTWFAMRAPEICTYTNFLFTGETASYRAYQHDITTDVRITGDAICAIGLRQDQDLILFLGSTSDDTVTTSARLTCELAGSYRLRQYDSQMGEWHEEDALVSAERLARGIPMQIERKGFRVLELQQAV